MSDGTDTPVSGLSLADVRLERIAALTAEVARLERELAESETAVEALEQKIRTLCQHPHGTCACSWDRPEDVCLWHSPKVKELERELAEARHHARDHHIESEEA